MAPGDWHVVLCTCYSPSRKFMRAVLDFDWQRCWFLLVGTAKCPTWATSPEVLAHGLSSNCIGQLGKGFKNGPAGAGANHSIRHIRNLAHKIFETLEGALLHCQVDELYFCQPG
eukprot:GHUV01041962.1.p2 GENE.GHUV01041962.1~~GHUV01041962.1.p2  ORF type:complete len:114 (+),score=11.82 GHUV01041962.1:493-834(+)